MDNVENTSIFSPKGSVRQEKPQIKDIANLPTEFQIPNKENFVHIKQFSELGGLHTCLPTSLLNGLVHTGVITSDAAERYQETFKTKNRKFFSGRNIGGRNMEVLAVPVGQVADSVSGELGVDAKIRTVGLEKMTKDEIRRYVISEIAQKHPIVGGSSDHAVLVVGYRDGGNQLTVIDPNIPTETKTVQTDSFVNQAKAGEPWLTSILEK